MHSETVMYFLYNNMLKIVKIVLHSSMLFPWVNAGSMFGLAMGHYTKKCLSFDVDDSI